MPAANPSTSPRAQTKPVQPETGLPAPTCPRKADLVRNVTGKAAGMWNQSLLLGMYQSCPERRDVQTGSWRGCAGLLRNVPWLPAPVTIQGRESTALLSSSPKEAECRTVAQIAPEAVQPGSGVIFGAAGVLSKGKSSCHSRSTLLIPILVCSLCWSTSARSWRGAGMSLLLFCHCK